MTPRRPWWKKKRWGAALLLWLVAAYPLSGVAFCYAVGRGWVPERAQASPAIVLAYQPLWDLPRGEEYGEWCVALGRQHARSSD
jgi:hypothetical protein